MWGGPEADSRMHNVSWGSKRIQYMEISNNLFVVFGAPAHVFGQCKGCRKASTSSNLPRQTERDSVPVRKCSTYLKL